MVFGKSDVTRFTWRHCLVFHKYSGTDARRFLPDSIGGGNLKNFSKKLYRNTEYERNSEALIGCFPCRVATTNTTSQFLGLRAPLQTQKYKILSNMITNWMKQKQALREGLEMFDFDVEIIKILKESAQNNQRIFICGNGGSAATADHLVCDIMNIAICSETKYQAMSLVSNIASITAIANDLSYDEIFSRQLLALGRKNDILIAISCSGNSKNIINVINVAKKMGIISIGVSGFHGGYLKQHADYNGYVSLNDYFVTEDVFSIFSHYIALELKNNK